MPPLSVVTKAYTDLLTSEGVEGIQADITTLEGQVATLDTRLDTAEADINTVEGSVSTLSTNTTNSLGVLESDVETLQNDLNTAETNIGALQTDLNTAESAITTLQGNVSTLQTTTSTLNTDLNTAEAAIVTLQSDVNAVESSVTTAQGNINTLQTGVNALDADVVALQSDVSTLEDTSTDHTNDISDLTTSLATTQGEIDALEAVVDDLETDLAAVPTDDYFDAVTFTRLGCFSRQQSPSFDCATLVNNYIDALGTSSGPLFQRPLLAEGGYWRFGDTITFPRRDGGAIIGTGGLSNLMGYNELTTQSLGVTRLVNVAATSSGVPVIDIASAWTKLDGFFLQGYSSDTVSNIYLNYNDYADIGILVRDRVDRYTGALYCPSLAIGACKTGIQLAETQTGNNADMNYFGQLWLNHCGTGIRSKSVQQVNLTAKQIIGFGCTDVINAELGGNWEIGLLYAGDGELAQGTILKIGTVNYWSPNADKFHIGTLTADASWTTGKILEIVGDGTGTVIIDALHIPQSVTTAATITVRSGWKVVINSGGMLPPGCIKFVEDTLNNYRPTVVLNNCTLHPDSTPTNLVSNTSTGRGTLIIRNLWEHDGSDNFSSWPTYNADQKWVDGALTSTRTLTLS